MKMEIKKALSRKIASHKLIFMAKWKWLKIDSERRIDKGMNMDVYMEIERSMREKNLQDRRGI